MIFSSVLIVCYAIVYLIKGGNYDKTLSYGTLLTNRHFAHFWLYSKFIHFLWELFPFNNIIYTVKPAHVVTSIKQSHFSCPVIENFIWIEPLLRGHLSYQAIFSLTQRWPLNTGLTVYVPSSEQDCNVTPTYESSVCY